jgi:hypothetical protein
MDLPDSGPADAVPPRWEAAAVACMCSLSALLMLRPVLLDPLALGLGSPRSEAPRHFWGLWATARGLWETGPFVAHLPIDFPTGYDRHLMDPVNLLFFLPPYWVFGSGLTGAVVGYNLVHAGWAALGALGAWRLARTLLGERPYAVEAALLAGFAGGSAPYLLATPWLGRTELLPGVGWALHLWLLHRALHRGRRRDLLLAGTSLGLVALGGWYLAAWLLLVEPVVALALARGAPGTWRVRVGRLAVVAGLATLLLLPALQALLAHPPPIMGEEQRISVHMGTCTPPQMLTPFATDQGLPGTDLSAYPGMILLLLAIAGAIIVPRKAAPWLLLALGLLVLSLGPYLVWSNAAPVEGAPDPMRLPAFWVETLLPPLRFIWGWARIGILVSAPLAVAAAFGVQAAFARLPSLRWQLLVMLCLGMAVEGTRTREPPGVRGVAFDPAPPPSLVVALADWPPGALLQLPFDDDYITWQPTLERPLAESQEVEDVRATSYLVQRAVSLQTRLQRGEAAPSGLLLPETLACVSADARALGQAGYAAIVVHKDRLPSAHGPVVAFLRAAIGAPRFEDDTLAMWVPEGQEAPPGLRCPLRVIGQVEPGADLIDDLTASEEP